MKVRKISIFNQLFILLALLLLIGNGALGLSVYNRTESALFKQIQSNVINIAQCAAANVSGDVLKEINIGDEGTDAYAQIIEELALFRDNSELEYIYTLREVGEEEFIFLVDSDPEEPAAIGDECEFTEALGAACADRVTLADDEPFSDEWGTHISAYSPVIFENEVVGAVGVDISANWVDEQMLAIRNLVIGLCIIIYVVSLGVLFLLMLKFKRSIRKLNDKVKELASGSGDLTKEIDIRSGDEMEVIAGNMNSFIRQIRKLIADVSLSVTELLQSSDELSGTIDSNNKIMFSMNSEIEGISANMEECSASGKILSENLSENAQQIAVFTEDIGKIRDMVQTANENAQRTSHVAKDNRNTALASIRDLQEKLQISSADMKKIERVKEIADEIGHIASQTRMLSLNAQIEAARAGTMGTGFAVVATEVGKLSNEIDNAVSEITEINNQIISASEAITNISNEMIRFVSEDVVRDYDAFANLGEEYGNTTASIRSEMEVIGVQSARISQNISDIDNSIKEIVSSVSITAKGANELALSTDSISESMKNLDASSKKNALHSTQLNEQVNNYTF